MRPRIYPAEAQYILEILEKDKAYYEKLEAELNEKMKALKLTASKACWCVRNYQIETAMREYNYPDCAKELCKLEADQIFILRKLAIHKDLVNKYRRIAEGKKGCGRYGRNEGTYTDYSIRHLNDSIFLGYKDYKMPMTVEAPKI
jgi:hypothetical protein